MANRLLICIILMLTSWSCTRDFGVQTNEPSASVTEAEYVVLAAIVDSIVSPKSPAALILDDSTTSGLFSNDADSALTKMLQYVGQHMSTLKSETILDFKSKNLIRYRLVTPAGIDPRCVRRSESNAIYPSISVSRVGFSSDNQQALAYVGIVDAPLAGWGSAYLLARQDERWKIVAEVMMWIS